VVTFALDALLDRGESVDEVVVIHLNSSRYRQAFQRLAQEFPGDRYVGRACHFRGVPVRTKNRVLDDIRNDGDAAVVWRTMHELVRTVKASGARIHLLLTGGRRMMGLLAVSAALLQLDHGDRVWHLYTPDEVRQAADEGKIMHVDPAAGVQLMLVPLAPLGAYFPTIRELAGATPQQTLMEQTRWLDPAERQRCQQVWDGLTERQRAVLRAFASGLGRSQTADTLHITVKTVDSHKRQIAVLCREAWEMPDGERVSYRFLERVFGPFLAGPV
jgi:CRISPR-associated protein Csx14